MTTKKLTLQPGTCGADVLDVIEKSVCAYMQNSRQISELQLRGLIQSDAEVRASYGRKCERGVLKYIAAGLPASVFGRAA